MHLEIQEQQRQVQRGHVYLSMQILELNAMELERFLNAAAQENPLLEASVPEQRLELEWIGTMPQKYGCRTQRDEQTDTDLPAENGESLEEYLSEQIAALHLDAKTEQALRFLVGNLNENGYLDVSQEALRAAWGEELYDRSLSLLQGLEPAGIGARNLAECLTLQLRRQGEQDPLLYELAQNYLEFLGKGQMKRIAQELRTSIARVERAKRKLVQLTPKPGNGFGKNEMGIQYILPDIEVVNEEKSEELRLLLADQYLPNYSISSYYASLLQNENLNAEEREYFQGKLRAARWIIECIDRRRTMLLNCAQIITQAHKPFFRSGKLPLHPLAVQEISEQLSVHPSTVYRTIKGKYIACRYGTFLLPDFLIRCPLRNTADRRKVGKDEVVQCMRRLIDAEEKRNPLSDQAIADRLRREGIEISRRTVSKYREEALLPAAGARRQH